MGPGSSGAAGRRLLVLVGCLNREAPYFQGARGKGIAVFGFDASSGGIERLHEVDDLDNPTFLAVHPSGRHVYVASEVFGRKEGVVAAYRFDAATGRLDYLNMQPSRGSICSYVSLSADGRFLLLANYGMGTGGPDRSVVVFPIMPDGSIAPPVSDATHRGVGADPERQERAHAHCIRPVGTDGELIAADLGIDRLLRYRLDADGRLTPAGEHRLSAGAGPRHVAVSPAADALFVINELDSTVQSFKRGADGSLDRVSTCSAVPPDVTGNHGADLHLSPDGRFLYASNRGHDSIAVLAVDPSSARLTPLGHVSTSGATPRSFAISPDGGHVFVANQNADEVAIFRRDVHTGSLAAIGARLSVGTPMCVRVLDRSPVEGAADGTTGAPG